MALRTFNGRILDLPEDALGAPTTINGLIWKKQEQTQWCWAACMDMVLQSTGDTDTNQCKLANSAFGQTGCCTSPTSFACNKPLQVLKIAPEWTRQDFECSFVRGSIEFNKLQTEINAGRPVEIGLKWTGGGGHAVLAVGWDIVDSVEQVFIHDPWRGELTIPYEKVKTAYGEGKWFWTWIGIKKD